MFKLSPNFGVVWAMFLSGIMPVTDTTTGRESVNHHVRSGRKCTTDVIILLRSSLIQTIARRRISVQAEFEGWKNKSVAEEKLEILTTSIGTELALRHILLHPSVGAVVERK